MSAYVYHKPVRRSRYADFRRYFFGALILVMAAGAIGFYVLSNLHSSSSKASTSSQVTTISDNMNTFIGPHFQFKDTGKWSLDKPDSTASRYVYLKYNKNQLEHELDIFVNQVPIPLNLATPRVLPVRIVNNDSLDITSVSSPCGAQYAKGELHKVKELTINGALMLCDPDNSQYFVSLAEINGDYRLKMTRPNGQAVQFVITYKDLGLDPEPDSLLNVAGSFRTR